MKESRVDSCWNVEVRCDLTGTLTLLALQIITTLATGWVCVPTCFHRVVVETNIDGGQKRGIASVARGGNDGAMICLRARWHGCPTLEKKWIMSDCCCGLQAHHGARWGSFLLVGAVSRWRLVGRGHEWHRSSRRTIWILEARRYRLERWPTTVLVPSSSHEPRAAGLDTRGS